MSGVVASVVGPGGDPTPALGAPAPSPREGHGGAGLRLESQDPVLVRCVAAAVANLEFNAVPGRREGEPARFLRAGGGYDEPWTRDAAINAWTAASWLLPDVAADTLRMVCERGPDGDVVAQDDQWWDQAIWVVAAWRHVLLTGDRGFLAWADGVARRSVAILDRDRFDPAFGLYRGPAVMQDGISGYPDAVVDPATDSSFVLDHAVARTMFSLSTNLVYAAAFDALAAMAAELGGDGAADAARAGRLREAVERWFRHGDGYGYLLLPRGAVADDGAPGAGTVLATAVADPADAHHADADRAGIRDADTPRALLDPSAETLGLAFAVLGGLVRGDRARAVVAGVHREPHGVVSVWPHLQDFGPDRPGRHNAICWPMIQGFWAQADAAAGDVAALGVDLRHLTDLVAGSGFEFFEVYHARTGAVDGGWQVGRDWASEPHQTWSATALLGVVLGAVLGLHPTPAGLRLSPTVPAGLGPVRLSGIRYGGALLDVTVEGEGNRLVAIEVDGVAVDPAATAHVPTSVREHAAATAPTVRVHARVA